ncbi:hypothetical protein CW751_13280 [Brumimicrobium salinarum]|uniref:Uncharacterized protein n=1 Tax=Brumimicrobium salinarum TaxID=2058658 RepID=A0A2I0QZP5_9FLAO|nr:hypothetical protein [Brumimicrobium salinarum]PKR79798.1 hypothetical protein CW751_13280 [Brumimicrobium salinarum]
MNQIINKKNLFLLFIGLCFISTSQEEKFKSPPKHENTYLFEVLKYERQPAPPEFIHNRILQILENPIDLWTPQDSLYFAYENVYLEKFERSLAIFSRLNTDTITNKHAQSLYRTALQKSGRYEALLTYNQKTLREDTSSYFSVKDAFLALNKAYIKQQNKLYIPDSTIIFPILKNPELGKLKRNASPHKNKIVQIAFAIDSAFRQFTTLHDSKDYILSQAMEEMGDFQREYLYISNALFYYSASRHYFKNDPIVAKKYNETLNEMSRRNYISLSFRTKFGKIIKNRYRIDDDHIEKSEKKVYTEADYIAPPKKKVRKDYLPWIDNSILIMLVLGLALIFVLIFMKVKK